ncbi:MAG: Mbeg1-like protein [Nostocoides sp.]
MTRPGSFTDRLRGTTPQPIDRTVWRLAWYSYGDHAPWSDAAWAPAPQPDLPQGWTRVPDTGLYAPSDDANPAQDRSSGFRAMVFVEADEHVVIGFRGTDSRKDWVANGEQLLGHPTEQYAEAMALARTALARRGRRVVFTGHSLGGGLAAAAALASGLTAVTFNAAGVHRHTAATAARLRGGDATTDSVLAEAATGQIRAYRTSTDILSAVQESRPGRSLPQVPGSLIDLPVPADADQSAWERQGRTRAPAAGAVLGAALTGGTPAGWGLGALAGAAAGSELAKGVHGHLYRAIDAGLAELFPE